MNIKKILAVAFLCGVSVFSSAEAKDWQQKGYTPEEIVILSRHNLRAPMKTNTKEINEASSHKWLKPDVPDGELSYRGGVLETMLGQYFDAYTEKEQLRTHLEKPEEPDVYFLAGSSERTIATARYFAAGMFPVYDVTIHQTAPLNEKDPIFTTALTFMNEPYKEAALGEIEKSRPYEEANRKDGDLASSYQMMDRILGKDSFAEPWKKPVAVDLLMDKKPQMKGALKEAHSLADMMILQYYETKDARKASWGYPATVADWQKIAKLKDAYNEILYMQPLTAINAAHPVLETVAAELKNPNRKFSFLCSHDSNMSAFLGAISVKPYTLPHSLEKRIPFGSKIVFEKWKNKEGQEFVALSMVYLTTEQIRKALKLTLTDPPMKAPLYLEGLKPNEDGLYPLQDVINRLENRIEEYTIWKDK